MPRFKGNVKENSTKNVEIASRSYLSVPYQLLSLIVFTAEQRPPTSYALFQGRPQTPTISLRTTQKQIVLHPTAEVRS